MNVYKMTFNSKNSNTEVGNYRILAYDVEEAISKWKKQEIKEIIETCYISKVEYITDISIK